MRRAALLASLMILGACASAPQQTDPRLFDRPVIEGVVSDMFGEQGDAAARALAPSLSKLGAPTGYVTGNMSAVADSERSNLFGVGEVRRRLTPLPEDVFWRIDGRDMGDRTAPIPTVHLLFDQQDPLSRDAVMGRTELETRRGHGFVVFEREVDQRVVVTVYPSAALPSEADPQSLVFLHG